MSNLSELKSNIDSLDIADMNELFLYLASKDKDNSDILSSLVSKVSAAIPEFSNISEASKVMRLLKIFSLLIYEYNHLTYDEFYNNFFLHSATGEFLDEYAKEVGLTRGSMHKARGFVRVGSSTKPSSPIPLPLLFVVSTEGTVERPALSYQALSSPSIYPSAVVENGVYWADAPALLEAVDGGEIYNVGSFEITEILTDLDAFDRIEQVQPFTGGYDRESDESLRERILERNRVDFILSDAYFINKTREQFGEIEVAIVRTPEGFGTIGLVIDTENADIIDAISEYWNDSSMRMLDFRVFVSAVERKYIDLSINLYHDNLIHLDIPLFNKIVFDYIGSLRMGQPFVKEYFEKELVALSISQGLKYFKTIRPTEDIIEVEENTKIAIAETANIFNLIESHA